MSLRDEELLKSLEATPVEEERDGLADVQEYLRGLRRRWKLILLLTALVVGASAVQFAITPAAYSARAVVQIERRSTTSMVSNQFPWLENLWNMEFYPTQYKLLESRGLAERVVDQLRLTEDPRFNPPRVGSEDSPPSREQDRAVKGRIADGLRAGLSVDPIRSTQLVQISYRDSEPVRAARVANAFAQAFIEWGIESRSSSVDKTSSFLGEQVDTLKQEISDREGQLAAFSRQEDLSFTPDTNAIYQRIEALNRDYIAAKRERIEKQARYEELVSTADQTVADIYSTGLVGDLMKDQLRLEREYQTRLQTFKPDWPEMVDLKSKIEEGRRNLDALVEQEARRARQTAHAEAQAAQRQESTLAREIEATREQVVEQNSSAVEFANLQVEVQARRELLDELLRRQSETEVAKQLQNNRESNVRIVDEALVPSAPYRPSLRNNLTMGLMAGLLLGFAGAFFLELMDRTIKSSEEVERVLKLPVLAVVPNVSDSTGPSGYGYSYGSSRRSKGKKGGAATNRRWLEKSASDAVSIELLPHTRPRLAASEVYRGLRTALLLSSTRQLMMIAVTSATAGEGKTVTSSNLAVVLAQLGRRVLLVDADLRKPRIHKVFNISNRSGLVHALTGSASFDDLPVRTAVPNLWVIPSGPIPPHPSELLASETMAELLRSARTRFDVVLLDTPPVLPVTDSILVGSMVDGVVICLRAGKVLREEGRTALSRLQRAGVKVLGAVLNGFRHENGRYGKRYRYYEAYTTDSSKEHPVAQ